MNDLLLSYSIGALLYCPANRDGWVTSLLRSAFGNQFSLALCLEDTIRDNQVQEAESILIQSLQRLFKLSQSNQFFIPKIFIRVRQPEQITSLIQRFDEAAVLVTGFIIPKFSIENADLYIDQITTVNQQLYKKYYIMPIFESPTMVPLNTRYELLYSLKDKLNQISSYVLNIRVGGNDLCNCFGFRRNSFQMIYDIRPVANLLTDIMTVFGMDYVVSGPVWEYYNGVHWIQGLRSELEYDLLNGFIGKTVIHPKQISIVNQCLAVSQTDFLDAKSLLNWDNDMNSLVSGNSTSERMNEFKTHQNWARKIIILSQIYGIRKDVKLKATKVSS